MGKQAVSLGCVAACPAFCVWWVLDWSGLVLCSSSHLIHMKEFCILMNVNTNHYVCLCVCSTPRGRAAWWCIQVSLNTDPLKTCGNEHRARCTRLRVKANVAAFYRPVFLTMPTFLLSVVNKKLYKCEHEAITKAQNISAGQSLFKVLKSCIEAGWMAKTLLYLSV